ncbi:MAG: DegT/DnrJ/EryC1/StrS family aminotransferase [Acidimicrobiia bacterium]
MSRVIPFGMPMIGEEERAAVDAVLRNPILVHGPLIKEFEAKFAEHVGAPHAVAVSSCTAGMHLTWMAKGIGEGDEVIVPAQTHVATAHAVELMGAKPVFADAGLDGNIDVGAIERSITSRTKGISVVHYLGAPVDMKAVMELATTYDIPVLEDCALAVGTTIDGVHAGLWGDVGCFSFYPVKHMTTAEGGMIITKDAELADRLGKLRAFGQDRTFQERTVPGVYDIVMLGMNYRINELQAVMGIEQLKKVDGFVAARRINATHLTARLNEIGRVRVLPTDTDIERQSCYCLSVVLDADLESKRIDIVEHLRANGVGTSVYYPSAVPMLTYYRQKYGYTADQFPNAHAISTRSIALPVGPHLDRDDMDYIADAFATALKEIA